MSEEFELKPIADEVRRQLEAVERAAAGKPEDDWTAEDESRLAEELKTVPSFREDLRTKFDPEEPKTVVFNGTQKQVHRTNNFPHLFREFVAARTGSADGNVFAKIYLDSVAQGDSYHFKQSMDKFEAQYPALYKKTARTTEAMRAALPKPGQSEEDTATSGGEAAERQFYSSVSYVALASILRQIDPAYKIELLYS